MQCFRTACFAATLFILTISPATADPAPGDACSIANAIVQTGGPDTSGVRHVMRCDGNIWQQTVTIDAAGQVGIGTPSPASALDVNGDIQNRNITDCTQLGTDSTGKIICLAGSPPPGSGMTLIATETASGTASLQFTNIPNGYTTIFLNCAGLRLSSDSSIRVQTGVGVAPTWNTSNRYTVSSSYTATNFDSGVYGYNYTSERDLTGESLFSDNASSPMSLKLYLDNISANNIVKIATYRASGSRSFPDDGYYTISGMGFWGNDTNPVTGLRLITTGGNISDGSCTLYGMN